MIIFLSSQIYDPLGHIKINVSRGTELASISRRATRTATLDGGATIADLGFSDSDRDFKIVINDISSDDVELIKDLTKNYPLVNLSCSEGVFSGLIDNLSANISPLTFSFIVKEKLSG